MFQVNVSALNGLLRQGFPKLTMLHGSAAQYWPHRGNDDCGWGWQKAVKKWHIGESLKQTSFLLLNRGQTEGIVSSTQVSYLIRQLVSAQHTVFAIYNELIFRSAMCIPTLFLNFSDFEQ